MEAETDPNYKQWDIPRNAQRKLFRALPLGRKLAIAADLADLVRLFQRKAPASAILSPGAWAQVPTLPREAIAAGVVAEEGGKMHRAPFRPAGHGSLGGHLRSACLAALLAASPSALLWAASDAKPSSPAPTASARVVKFVHVPEILEEQGPRPKNVWVYGRFTARGPVSDGLFVASVNEGINWPDWEEHFNLIDNPGNYVFRRVVFSTKSPLPEMRKGTKFMIPKEHPARLVEIDQVDGTIARMVLESPPVIESQVGAGQPVKPGTGAAGKASVGERPRRLVYFKQLGSIAKVEGSHPANLWTWGNFSARSDLRDGIFTATPAGVESRRVIEWIAGAVLIYPIVEIPSRVIFYTHRPRKIRNGDRIEITAKHPAQVRRLFESGGVLVWLDLDPPQTSGISVRLGSSGGEPALSPPAPSTPAPNPAPGAAAPIATPSAGSQGATPTEAPSPERVAAESP
ncbi:hypothetical protein [Methylacidimicrobium sp. B4]|uniref:hypothetical protein n=1 Tax=Methylacidimicrobium sp. B4 TaxID=2796139 RepID=UPI001A8DBE37|nr:hypothetical protein [Methylacidimicrobium sp. B4]QSR84954.1 hypothetical protein MacB4_01375 [Methylacidimicrobium sp. B4]